MVLILLNGLAIAAESERVFHGLPIAHGVAHAGFPLIPGDWISADRKRILDRNFMLDFI
jgi:hypothetical protein